MNRPVIFCALIFLFSSRALASPCCAGSSAAPSLILGDHQTQLGLGAALSRVIADTTDAGRPIFRARGHDEVVQTYTVSAANLLSDRLQVGAKLPLVRREISRPGLQSRGTSFGDASLQLGYEVISEMSYGQWPSRLYLYQATSFPTGHSVYESSAVAAADATGSGFFSTGLGAVALQRLSSRWDAIFTAEGQYQFSRDFENGLSVHPGPLISAALGVGYAPVELPLRVGFRLGPNYQSSRELRAPSRTSTAGAQLNWDSIVEASYNVLSELTIMASFTDQTLFGPVRGANLNRVIALSALWRWDR